MQALTVADINETVEGLEIVIRRSKTDQEGHGFCKAVVCHNNPLFFLIRALTDYLKSAGITSGPIFHPIGKSENICDCALSGTSVSFITKDSAKRSRLDPSRCSGHSLCAGLVTTADKEGASMAEIMAQTEHRSANTVIKYIFKS